jgi:trans-aconitate methyltransferase
MRGCWTSAVAWGRITRFLARDLRPGRLYGCDPVEDILDVCRRSGVPATLARSDFLPDRLPFEEQFDLVFAFSVFTHLSEAAHERCLRALHRAISPGWDLGRDGATTGVPTLL